MMAAMQSGSTPNPGRNRRGAGDGKMVASESPSEIFFDIDHHAASVLPGIRYQ